ncbi:hypothetical protein JOB18_045796 [Solea senegalensis]|uniref:Myb/SANT-like DNA-binding domain-containing protein n=1 Tax=Solea senegalensis TaxID=28829 RepID=A0AAV6R0V7_SOLSE|nr:uncharacterized protein si:dkeyp-38g8.5 isoform X1 [Solea senegalensis]KAG7497911.1 hypothetical protein JOB18_045796 [Solea senegalensis]
METRDHDYTGTTYNNVSSADNTYKMTSKETEDFVKLRVLNDNLFSGKRNTTMTAWRAILKQMGLQHKMTHRQASKKWENLRKKHKELKNPPDGVTVFPKMWRHFRLMDEAILRLEGSAHLLNGLTHNKDKSIFLPFSKPKKRTLSTLYPATSVEEGPEIEVTLSGDDEEVSQERRQDMNRVMQEVEDEWNVMESEKRVIKREKGLIERERLVLQRERAVLDREAATLERDRASLEREKVTFEREKDGLEKERVMVERDRDDLRRERQALEREKARLERLFIPKGIAEVAEHGGKDAHVVDMNRKERFLYLFEKLVEDF